MEKVREDNGRTEFGSKKRIVLEMTACILGMAALTVLMAVFGADAGLLAGAAAYWIPCGAVLFYVLKVEKLPLSYVGLKPLRVRDIFEGLGLGVCMFIVQQIPLLLMRMDYSAYAMAPDAVYIVVMVLYCFFLRRLCGGVDFPRVSAEKDDGCLPAEMGLRGNQYSALLSDSLVYHAAYFRGVLQPGDECGDFMHLSFPQKGGDDCAANRCARFL